MAVFNFSTISSAQALAIGFGDSLIMDLGPGNTISVLFDEMGAPTITQGTRTVAFGSSLSLASKSLATGGGFFLGNVGGDQWTFGSLAVSSALYGGDGGDTLQGSQADDILQGNQGRDSLNGGLGADVIYGGQDDDRINTGGGADFAQGNKGDDFLLGSGAGSDTLLGGQGNDVLNADSVLIITAADYRFLVPNGLLDGNGSDVLNGNLGDDSAFGTSGNDRIFGESGNDVLTDLRGGANAMDGGDGDDTLVSTGVDGLSTLVGGGGNDLIVASYSATVDAGDGDDRLLLQSNGAATRVVAALGEGADVSRVLNPQVAGDSYTIDAGGGNDLISAGDSADSITGGTGDDTLNSNGGGDTVAGGAGVDQFQYFGRETTAVFEQVDWITDWSSEDRLYFQDLNTGMAVGAPAAGNYLEGSAATYDAALLLAHTTISAGAINYVVVQVGADVFVFADSQNDDAFADSAVKLVGRTLADIDITNFEAVTRFELG